jgi:hypothetical protein
MTTGRSTPSPYAGYLNRTKARSGGLDRGDSQVRESTSIALQDLFAKPSLPLLASRAKPTQIGNVAKSPSRHSAQITQLQWIASGAVCSTSNHPGGLQECKRSIGPCSAPLWTFRQRSLHSGRDKIYFRALCNADGVSFQMALPRIQGRSSILSTE